MPLLKKANILFDLSHNEMLNIEEEEFSEFYNLLLRLNIKINVNKEKELLKELLVDKDILIIGNPIDDYFSQDEIRNVINFVRKGGNILLLSEYGADYLQKTNINDISGPHFGIYFENNLIKGLNNNNQNSTSLLNIQNFGNKKIRNGLREMIIGGTCSISLEKGAKPLLWTSECNIWSEWYNNSLEVMTKAEDDSQIIGAYSKYGKGKIIALGDIDIFTNDLNIGISQLDNQIFITNILNWLIAPLKEPDLISFALNQLGEFDKYIASIKKKINNVIESITLLEKRISKIEDKINMITKNENTKSLLKKNSQDS